MPLVNDIPEARLAVIGDEVWDLETEEPLTSTEAYEAIVAELATSDLEDDVFVDLVLAGVIHHVMGERVD